MKRALVTGATRGPGRTIALALARSGWQTHALGRDRSALDDMRADSGVVPLAIDLTDRDDMRAVAVDVTPSLLVHAALRWPDEDDFANLSESAIDMALEVNLSAALQLTHTVLPTMLAAGHGHIIFVLAPVNQFPSLLQETVRGASEAFVRMLRDQVGPSGVAVDAVRADPPAFSRTASAVLSLSGSSHAGITTIAADTASSTNRIDE